MLANEQTQAGYADYGVERGWTPASFGTLTHELEHYMDCELRRHKVDTKAGSKWLELGYGSGDLLEFARRRRASIYGVEAQADLLELGRRAGFPCEGSLSELLQKYDVIFDVILAFDVFEHISHHDLIGWLRMLRSRAHAETKLVARFPNGDSPFSMPMQNGDITHQTQLGSGAVSQILRLSGWECAYLGEPAWVAASALKQLKTSAKAYVRQAVELLVGRLYFGSGGPPSLYQNYLLVAQPSQPR